MPSKGLMTLLKTSPPPLWCLGTLLWGAWGGGERGRGREIRMPAKLNDQSQRGFGSGTVGRAGKCTS